MSRPSKEHYFMSLALLAAQRASCPRRKVGCILVDANSHVVSTGYNGPPSGTPNCTDKPCGGHNQPSGQGLSLCIADHAEINAYRQAGDRLNTVTDMFLTAGPCCEFCTATTIELIYDEKLKNMKRVYFFDHYPSNTAKFFEDLGIELICLDKNLDPNGFLFKLAVTLGFRKEPSKPNQVVCIGGILHGCKVTCNGNYLRADATENTTEELRPLNILPGYLRFNAPTEFKQHIHEYYSHELVGPRGRFRVMRYSDLDDKKFNSLVHETLRYLSGVI